MFASSFPSPSTSNYVTQHVITRSNRAALISTWDLASTDANEYILKDWPGPLSGFLSLVLMQAAFSLEKTCYNTWLLAIRMRLVC